VRVLVAWAVAAAAVVAGLEALTVVFGWHVPVWTLVALPCVAACAAFLIAGRRRAVRLQRERRARHGRPRRPGVTGARKMGGAPSGARDHVLVPIRADDGALER
jgi:hypothetical protein